MKTWAERLDEVEAGTGSFDQNDRTMAYRWETCAVGERGLCPDGPDGDGPEDDVLRELGQTFTSAVFINNIPEARRALNAIAAYVTGEAA